MDYIRKHIEENQDLENHDLISEVIENCLDLNDFTTIVSSIDKIIQKRLE